MILLFFPQHKLGKQKKDLLATPLQSGTSSGQTGGDVVASVGRGLATGDDGLADNADGVLGLLEAGLGAGLDGRVLDVTDVLLGRAQGVDDLQTGDVACQVAELTRLKGAFWGKEKRK